MKEQEQTDINVKHLETSKRIVLGVGIYAGIFLIVAMALMCYSVAAATYIKDLALAMITFTGTIFIGYMSKAFLENVNKYQKGSAAVDVFNNSMQAIVTKSAAPQQSYTVETLATDSMMNDFINSQENCG